MECTIAIALAVVGAVVSAVNVGLIIASTRRARRTADRWMAATVPDDPADE